METLSARPQLRLLLDHLSTIQDTRQSWKVAYPLREVLFLVVCGTIARASRACVAPARPAPNPGPARRPPAPCSARARGADRAAPAAAAASTAVAVSYLANSGSGRTL